jgi:hypothetical protein
MDPANTATALHQEQRQRVSTYKPKKPEIPTNHNCPGGQCSQPVPPLPPGSVDSFCSGNCGGGHPTGWWVVMGVAALSFAWITVGRRSK